MPGGEAAGDAVGVEADRAERLRDHARAHAPAAHEGHGARALERRCTRGDALDLDVSRTGGASRVPLVLLADVDQIQLTRRLAAVGLRGIEVERRIGEEVLADRLVHSLSIL